MIFTDMAVKISHLPFFFFFFFLKIVFVMECFKIKIIMFYASHIIRFYSIALLNWDLVLGGELGESC
jgi:hypothetical protein